MSANQSKLQFGTSDILGNTYNIETQQASLDLWSNNRLTTAPIIVSTPVRHTRARSPATEDRLGLYVQGEWRFTDASKCVGGARYDLDIPLSIPRSVPRFTLLLYHSLGPHLRATVSVGYRPPTLFET